jgi:H/ACA ribonucleoprotein complex subunit 4
MNQEKPITELLEFCLINIDKPSNLTSFQVCEKIRKILNAKKVGHAGTLDPQVTGVLPLLVNRACKLSEFFMKKDKEYIGKMYLHSDIDESKLREEMEKFIGRIMQKPPVRSRVKRVLRERIVNKFKIIKKEGRVVSFESDVQAGTYIRKLISDLGEKIGGAHMIELRRIRAGIFKIEESHTIEQVERAFSKYRQKEEELRKILIPAEIIQRMITRLDVKEEAVKGLLNGKPLMKNDKASSSGLPDENSKIAVFCKNKFIGVYEVIKENNEIIAKPEFVMN